MPETGNCTTLEITLLVTPKGDKRKLSFGISRTCPEETRIEWVITFTLEEKKDDEWIKRVDFKLKVNVEAPKKVGRAELLFNKRNLSTNQLMFVNGPMYLQALDESEERPVPQALLDRMITRANARLDAAETAQNNAGAAAATGGGQSGQGAGGAEDAGLNTEVSAFLRDDEGVPSLKDLTILFLDID